MRCGLFVAMILSAGCTRIDPGAGGTASNAPAKRGDPWASFATEVARTPEAVAVRRLLAQLNSELESQRIPLPDFPDAEKTAVQLNPSAEEMKDWTARLLTPMDANYLAECLFFKQVAHSLDVSDAPVTVKAKTAFDWVNRQVYLRSWLMGSSEQKTLMPPLPAYAVLKRGYGTGVERETVFITLTRQMGLDPVLIGVPGNETKPRFDGRSPRGAFWAVGIRDGNDIIVFDTWTAQTWPKLSELKTNPRLVLDRLPNNAPGVRPEDIQASIPYAVIPMSAVTPRMKLISEKVQVKAHQPLTDGPIYAPPVEVDRLAYPHALGSFTPKDEGGFDATPAGPNQLAALANEVEPLTPAQQSAPGAIRNEMARSHFRQRAASMYKNMVPDTTTDERIQLGQFNDAIRQLNDLDKRIRTLQAGVRIHQADQQAWYPKLDEAYDLLAQNKVTLDQVNRLWAEGLPFLQNAVAELAAHDIAYAFALCKHEQAERTQLRLRKGGDAQRAAADWAVAKDAWERYLDRERFEASHPGRNAHAKSLAERARKLANNPEAP